MSDSKNNHIDITPKVWVAKPSCLENIKNSSFKKYVSMGWQPDLPDFRDRHTSHPQVKKVLKGVNSIIINGRKIPSACDNRNECSPIEDQEEIGSCTAQAVVGLMEYMMLKAGHGHINGSRLFTYKVTRNLLGWQGDLGAYLRTTMQSVAAFGVCPEKYWPYDISKYDDEPTAFHYSFADNFKALNYTRIDHNSLSNKDVLESVKRVLVAGYCVVFGFTVYSSMSSGNANIPYPEETQSVNGGHAVLAVGYDDKHKNEKGMVVPSLIIRNSWGIEWGEQGYGYLPYRYVLNGLAKDFWTSFKWDWIDTKQFS